VAYIPIEETYLEDIHGEEYRQYQERTNRYLGLPWGEKKGDSS